MSQEH